MAAFSQLQKKSNSKQLNASRSEVHNKSNELQPVCRFFFGSDAKSKPAAVKKGRILLKLFAFCKSELTYFKRIVMSIVFISVHCPLNESTRIVRVQGTKNE